MVILQRNDLKVLECGTAFGILSHLWFIFVRNETFHHVAIVAAHFVTVASHSSPTICHYNGIKFDVARLIFGKLGDRFLWHTMEDKNKNVQRCYTVYIRVRNLNCDHLPCIRLAIY